MTEDKTPETQDKSEEEQKELVGGKFKSTDDLLAAYQKQERELADAKESLDRAERLNQLYDYAKEEPKNAEPEPQMYTPLTQVMDEEQANAFDQVLAQREKVMLGRINQQLEKRLEDYRNQEYATRRFYELYPDLKGFDSEVVSAAQELAMRLGEKSKSIPLDKKLAEVATMVKERLNETKRKLTKTHLHLESGQTQEPQIDIKTEEAASPDETARTQRYFDEEVKAFNEKKFRPLRG
jgi:hypothetical protein